MKTCVKKIAIGEKKKRPRPSFGPTFLFLAVAAGILYYVWTQPVALELKRGIDVLIRPIRDVIDGLLSID